MAYLAVAAAWISTAAAVSFAVYLTGSAEPLLALCLPAFLEVKHTNSKEKQK